MASAILSKSRSVVHWLALTIVAVAAFAGVSSAATTHRNACHTRHTCPSDHHTYRWQGLSCTSYANERVPKDKIVRVVGGRRYWCHR